MRPLFVYGTLKRGFPNYKFMQSMLSQKELVFKGTCITQKPYPLVCGPHYVPYMLHLPDMGKPVKGELYSVSAQALKNIDYLEATHTGEYERLPIQVKIEHYHGEDEIEDKDLDVLAEAYFVNWYRNKGVVLGEYTSDLAGKYDKDRPATHYRSLPQNW